MLQKPRKFPAAFSSKSSIPWFDILLAVTGTFAALYIVLDYEGIASRYGRPNGWDIAIGVYLLVVLLEATRRVLGPLLPFIALLFIGYGFLGPHMPGVLAFKGVSLSRFIGQMTMATEGVYGIPLMVSAEVVFLYVVFGALLDKAGAGRYFIELAMSVLGSYRGGPAKAAILGSGLTGTISGSSIANVVTTGTFTIPLMKKVGYPAKKAAAIEVAASTDGQLAPPIMGAAAFIIAEYVNVPYVDVIKAAIIPALASYGALFYIAHIEAVKLGLQGLPRSELSPFVRTFMTGWYYWLPVVVLLVELIAFRHSPARAAILAIATLIPLMLFRHIRRPEGFRPGIRQGGREILMGLVSGSTNMLTVALATATAGIIVGIVALGPGGLIAQIIDQLAMGSIYLMLFFTAAACLLIGMGLPTTATYIVMATLTAPAILILGADYGLAVPLMAAHLFVFYFGILADDTPPVGLAAYAAAAIARADAVATGIQAFMYDIRTALLPFMFIFNSDLILHNIDNWGIGLLIAAGTCLANIAFVSLTQRWIIRKTRWYESLLLLSSTAILFRPDYFGRLLHIDAYHWLYLPGALLFFGTYLLQKRA